MWALLNTVEVTKSFTNYSFDNGHLVSSIEERVLPPGSIVNIIEYNGTDPYTPPEGTELAEVLDGSQVGDFIGL